MYKIYVPLAGTPEFGGLVDILATAMEDSGAEMDLTEAKSVLGDDASALLREHYPSDSPEQFEYHFSTMIWGALANAREARRAGETIKPEDFTDEKRWSRINAAREEHRKESEAILRILRRESVSEEENDA